MEIVIASLGSGVISTLISCLFQLHSDKKKKLDKLENGMSLLLLSAMKTTGKSIIANGTVSKSDYDSFCATYDAYKSLGGDGWADGIKKQVDALEKTIDE
jgi:hypothetical protein